MNMMLLVVLRVILCASTYVYMYRGQRHHLQIILDAQRGRQHGQPGVHSHRRQQRQQHLPASDRVVPV